MAQSKITLIGVYNYMAQAGDDLFLNLTLPTGIDKETVTNNILMRGGEFEILFSDPYLMRDTMTTWSKKWHWTFDRWIKAINIEYNPLENYDRIETSTDTEHAEGNSSATNNNTRTDNLSTATSSTIGNTSENKVSAFDSSTYSPSDMTEGTTTSSESIANTGTQTNANDISTENENDITREHNARLHGNIGVTTSQQMLQSEIDIAMFNLYDRITDVFLQEYVIPIY